MIGGSDGDRTQVVSMGSKKSLAFLISSQCLADNMPAIFEI